MNCGAEIDFKRSGVDSPSQFLGFSFFKIVSNKIVKTKQRLSEILFFTLSTCATAARYGYLKKLNLIFDQIYLSIFLQELFQQTEKNL